jgi:hypothetical protein
MIKIYSILITPLVEFSNNSFWRIFFVIATMNLVSTIVYNHFVWSDSVYLNESSLESSDAMFIKGSNSRTSINFIVDFISPIWLFTKLGIGSALVFAVSYVLDIKILVREIFKVFLVSFIFIVIGDLIYSIILLFINTPSVRNDILHFYPMSFLSFFDPKSDYNQYYYIFSRINFFQALFIISIFFLFRYNNGLSLKNSLLLTLTYILFYALLLIVWFLFSV